MMINNIYTLGDRKSFLLPVTDFPSIKAYGPFFYKPNTFFKLTFLICLKLFLHVLSGE